VWSVGRTGVVLAAVLLAGCTADAPAPGPPPASAPAPATTRAVPTAPLPVAQPRELDLGDVEIDRPVTGEVVVRPARVPITFGATELRGGSAYELSGDGCSRRRLDPAGEGCRLRVTVLARGTGEIAAKLVLPHNRGTLTVPVTARVPLSYTVVVTVRGGGTVTGDRGGISCSQRCTARVPQGALLTLTGSAPARWGTACPAGPVCRVRVDTPLDITADFG
jgi:hypothetical protein